MKARMWLLGLAITVLGCSAEERDKPPDYSPEGTFLENKLTCDALRQAGSAVDKVGRFESDGGQARCSPDGLECSLGECDGGIAGAKCVMGYWTSRCTVSSEGGKHEAGDPVEAGPEAEAGDPDEAGPEAGDSGAD